MNKTKQLLIGLAVLAVSVMDAQPTFRYSPPQEICILDWCFETEWFVVYYPEGRVLQYSTNLSD